MVREESMLEAQVARFEALEKRRNGGAGWLRAVRRAAFARFTALGFPSARDEAWRGTDVSALGRLRCEDPVAGTGAAAPELQPWMLSETAATMVFVDGCFDARASRLEALAPGLRVRSLAAALRHGTPALEAHLTRHASYADHAFTALNTALFDDGACIEIEPGRVVAAPIQVLFVTSGRAVQTQPRVLVVAGEASQASLVESHAALHEGAGFTNAVTEIVLAPGAVFAHARIQEEAAQSYHIATLQAQLDRDSRLDSDIVALGGRLSRNEVNVAFGGPGGDAGLRGLYAAGGSQHTDLQTFVDHATPQCSSRQLYKGILGGQARGVFNGRVRVRPAAQKTDARQTNRNLLLTEEALVDTKPQLEIHADDVRCTHGATIGRLDEDALYYLRSRGIGLEAARGMLLRAFAGEVLAGLGVAPLRSRLEAVLEARLAALVEVVS